MPANIVPQSRDYTSDWPETPGIAVADGAVVKVHVKNGHLIVEDGIAGSRRERKYSKVTRDLHRLLILTYSGYITFDAIGWMKDKEIPWSHYSKSDGLLATSGPTRTDARLLRSQAYAPATNAGLEAAQYLLSQKLRQQAENLCLLGYPGKGGYLAGRADVIETAESLQLAVSYEGPAAQFHWAAWREAKITVPFGQDARKVPDHWHVFNDRLSQSLDAVTNKSASTPINAILNYLYGIGFSECIHACHAIGLSPSMGIIHSDKPSRESFALDCLEVIRPACERIVIEMLATGERVDRRWFHESSDGTVYLMPAMTHRLAGYSMAIADSLAPHVYHVAKIIARYGDGEIHIPAIKQTKVTARSISVQRLRKGTRTTDVVPDECWQTIRVILPEYGAGARVSECPERDMIAALAIRYILQCPWSQTLIHRGHQKAASRRLIFWQKTGSWEQIRDVLVKSGHLDSLLSS